MKDGGIVKFTGFVCFSPVCMSDDMFESSPECTAQQVTKSKNNNFYYGRRAIFYW